MDEILGDYFAAANCYTAQTFDHFFELAQIEPLGQKLVFKDMLTAMGALYLNSMRDQKNTLSKGDQLSEISRAKKASANLAEALGILFNKSRLGFNLNEAALAKQHDLIEEYGENSDTYKIISSIFPFDKSAHGFRQTGLENTIAFIHSALGEIEAEQLENVERGRLTVLKPWVSSICFLWFLAKGKLPSIGHYDKEIGDYDSPDIAALVYAIEQIDPQVSSRIVVDAVKQAKSDIETDSPDSWLPYSLTMMLLLSTGETHTHKENLKMFLRLPNGGAILSDEMFDQAWGSAQRGEPETTEQSFISKEQFFETLISSKNGKLLLQREIELAPK